MPEPEPFWNRFGAVLEPSFSFVFYNRIASRPQSGRKKPVHGGMQNFAFRRVLVFYDRIQALMQSDCKKQMKTTTSKRLRNDSGSGAGKTLNSDKNVHFPKGKWPCFGVGLGAPWGDLKSPAPINV